MGRFAPSRLPPAAVCIQSIDIQGAHGEAQLTQPRHYAHVLCSVFAITAGSRGARSDIVRDMGPPPMCHLCAPRDKGKGAWPVAGVEPIPASWQCEVARASPTNLICLDCPNVRCRFLIAAATSLICSVWTVCVCVCAGSLGSPGCCCQACPLPPLGASGSFVVSVPRYISRYIATCVHTDTPPSSTPPRGLSAGSREGGRLRREGGRAVVVRRRGCRWVVVDVWLPTSIPCHGKLC